MGLRKLFAFLLLTCLVPALGAATEVRDIRVSAGAEHTRVVLDLSARVSHKVFTLPDPDRVVVDLVDASMARGSRIEGVGRGHLRDIRSGIRNGNDLRLVLDLAHKARPKSFLLPPDGSAGYRLVIDLEGSAPGGRQPDQPVKSADSLKTVRDVVVAIDAGHGGKDPGAHGRYGTDEKDVVLQIARRLARVVDAEPGMRAVLTRDGDYFLTLRERINRAREENADLFVSIHADAFRDRRVHGSSVYVLSRRGASSEMARILAQSENAADLVGGVSLNDKDDLLRSVILDLSQSASIEASLEVGDNVLTGLKQIGKVHKESVQKAGFVVLKSPDIPSILVETAFISNPTEERKLKDPAHQVSLARAMLSGIRNYFYTNPPPGTYVALHRQQKYVIRRGDTLSEIARRYDVSLQALKVANGLRSDRVRVGETLRIPVNGEG